MKRTPLWWRGLLAALSPARSLRVVEGDTLPAKLPWRNLVLARDDGEDWSIGLRCPCGCGQRLEMMVLKGANAVFVPPVGASPELVDLQKSALASQMEEFAARLSALDEQIGQGEANRAAIQSTIAKLAKTVPLARKRMEMRVNLAKRELGTKLHALVAVQEYVEQKEELQVQQDRATEAARAVAALKDQRRQAESEFRRKTLDDLAVSSRRCQAFRSSCVRPGRG